MKCNEKERGINTHFLGVKSIHNYVSYKRENFNQPFYQSSHRSNVAKRDVNVAKKYVSLAVP